MSRTAGHVGVACATLAALSATAAAAPPDPAALAVKMDWPTVLKGAVDLPAWPQSWGQGAFTGNGREGLLVGTENGALTFRLGRSDVVDHRVSGDTTMFQPCFDSGRLPIGQLVVRPKGKVDPRRAMPGGIDLWLAEAWGRVTSDAGQVHWRAWTPRGAAVNVVELETSGGEAVQVTYEASPAVSTRAKRPPKDYGPHPPAVETTEGDIRVSTQAFPAGGGYTVAWRVRTVGPKTVVVSAIGYDRTGDGHRAEALAAVRAADDLDALRTRHRAAWAAWWARGWIALPDPDLQKYYWLQLHKLGSAVRSDGPMLDLMGPWFGGGPWPAIWWNLNVQLAYQPCAAANRVDLLDSLVGMLERSADAMGADVPAEWGGPAALAIGRISSYDGRSRVQAANEAGNLTWALGVAWEGYLLTGDRRRAERLLPLMARAAAFHVARARPGPDGLLHLPVSHSPESGAAADCTYELGPMRWLLRTLVEAEQTLGWKHPDQPRWRDVLAKLTPIATDENGILRGAGSPVPLGHRHWSHLVHVYPLRDFDPADAKELDLVRRSVAHWTSNRSEWRGYSGLGAASMWALLGEADRTLEHLERIRGLGGANTLYREEGPCIETPLQAAATLQEVLLTWDRRGVRVFAGTPPAWKDAAFHQLRAPLGLTISARRAGGSTQWVRVEAAVAQTVRLEPRIAGTPVVRSAKPVALKDVGQGWYEFPLEAGQAVLLAAPAFTGQPTVEVLPAAGR